MSIARASVRSAGEEPAELGIVFGRSIARPGRDHLSARRRKMVRLNPILTRAVRIMETAKTLVCPELGTRYRALSAEATTAFGLSPSLIIHDELGRVRGPRSQLYEALETAVGAQEAPLKHRHLDARPRPTATCSRSLSTTRCEGPIRRRS